MDPEITLVKLKNSNPMSHELSESEREESPGVEIVPTKWPRKVPAKFKDSVCTPTA